MPRAAGRAACSRAVVARQRDILALEIGENGDARAGGSHEHRMFDAHHGHRRAIAGIGAVRPHDSEIGLALLQHRGALGRALRQNELQPEGFALALQRLHGGRDDADIVVRHRARPRRAMSSAGSPSNSRRCRAPRVRGMPARKANVGWRMVDSGPAAMVCGLAISRRDLTPDYSAKGWRLAIQGKRSIARACLTSNC